MAIGINHIRMALARTNLPCLCAMAVGSDAQLVVQTRVAPASARVLVQSFSMLKCTGCLAAKVMSAYVLPTTTSIISGTVLSSNENMQVLELLCCTGTRVIMQRKQLYNS